ncbi:hypothetical protein HNP25_000435 [Arcicella rosea]|uniref:Uncharacterized protein n=1 Tax=Arcicella rosea TaxID=502909 RepID=A0A841EF72_9BACT|nr:hypothetical protein [Arcicella rosea]
MYKGRNEEIVEILGRDIKQYFGISRDNFCDILR